MGTTKTLTCTDRNGLSYSITRSNHKFILSSNRSTNLDSISLVELIFALSKTMNMSIEIQPRGTRSKYTFNRGQLINWLDKLIDD